MFDDFGALTTEANHVTMRHYRKGKALTYCFFISFSLWCAIRHASISNMYVSSTRTPESGALYVAMHLCACPAPVAALICWVFTQPGSTFILDSYNIINLTQCTLPLLKKLYLQTQWFWRIGFQGRQESNFLTSKLFDSFWLGRCCFGPLNRGSHWVPKRIFFCRQSLLLA